MRRPPSTSRFADARWIWPAVLGRPVNRYVEFEQRFVLSGAPDARAELMIAADTVYAVWVNGVPTFRDGRDTGARGGRYLD